YRSGRCGTGLNGLLWIMAGCFRGARRSAVIGAGGEVGESGNEPAHADGDEGEADHGLGHVCEVHRGFLCCALERVLRGASVGEVRRWSSPCRTIPCARGRWAVRACGGWGCGRAWSLRGGPRG